MNPYPLFLSLRSPFSRRIRLACKRFNIPIEERVVDAWQEPRELLDASPLGAVPVLITPNFGPLCDSSNILEYLHEISGAIWPANSGDRIAVRQASTLALGIINASVQCFQEVQMHESPSPKWANDYVRIIADTLRTICEGPKSPFINADSLTQAGWDLAVAIEYLELRVPSAASFTKNASLVELIQLARADSFFRETKPTL